MKTSKSKILQICSNGSIKFIFKNFKDSPNNFIFLEKDLKNFHFNIKTSKILTNNEIFFNYKNKFNTKTT
jgi:hypothetical protein